MKVISTKIHTIFITVGPTNCGKTTFTKDVFLPQFPKGKCVYLSSDNIRRELLDVSDNNKIDKYHPMMTAVSKSAFELLYTKLDALTSFPVSKEFVIVDSTGLSEDTRKRFIEIAQKNNYNIELIVFKFKSSGDYYENPNSSKFLITKHIKRLNKDVLPNLKVKQYTNVNYIKSRDFYDYKLEIKNYNDYLKCILDPK